MKLDGYGIQNESEEGDSILKKSKTTCLRIEEPPKPLSFCKKENYIVNPTLMQIKFQDIPNETLAHQIRKNPSFYSRLM
ncbi:8681_t:CDS:2, partial [Gigaspora margarita]